MRLFVNDERLYYGGDLNERKVECLARTYITDLTLPVVAILVAADCEGRSQMYDGVYNGRVEDAIRTAVRHGTMRCEATRRADYEVDIRLYADNLEIQVGEQIIDDWWCAGGLCNKPGSLVEYVAPVEPLGKRVVVSLWNEQVDKFKQLLDPRTIYEEYPGSYHSELIVYV